MIETIIRYIIIAIVLGLIGEVYLIYLLVKRLMRT